MKRMGVIGWPEEEKKGRAGGLSNHGAHDREERAWLPSVFPGVHLHAHVCSFLSLRRVWGWARPPELAAAKEQEICGRMV